MPTNEEITRHHFDEPPPPGEDPWVDGQAAAPYEIKVVEYDERWPADFERVAGRIREPSVTASLEIHHVGSTSVPGLPAKPVIDVDLVVADSADETAYIPALEAAGFVHTIREPWWHEHRLVKHDAPVTTCTSSGRTALRSSGIGCSGSGWWSPDEPRRTPRRSAQPRR